METPSEELSRESVEISTSEIAEHGVTNAPSLNSGEVLRCSTREIRALQRLIEEL